MHPRSVNRVKLEGKTIDDEVLHNTLIFFVMYMLIVAVSTLLVASFDECDFTTNLTAVIACMGNIGPGLGKVGPMGNFSEFSALSNGLYAGNLEEGIKNRVAFATLLFFALQGRCYHAGLSNY